ncbi:MAG: hypothetical protein ABL886_06920 [Rhodoglobus sp.]
MRRLVVLASICGCSYKAPATSQDAGNDAQPDSAVDGPVDSQPVDTQPGVFWQAITGATADENNLTKSTGLNQWGDSGASSVAMIVSGNCFVEFTTAEFNKGKTLGLSNGDANRSFEDIDFAIQLGANGRVFIYEGASQIASPGTYAASDVFRIEAIGSTISYYQNGVLLLARTKTPTFPLLVDAALFSANATLRGVTLGNL